MDKEELEKIRSKSGVVLVAARVQTVAVVLIMLSQLVGLPVTGFVQSCNNGSGSIIVVLAEAAVV